MKAKYICVDAGVIVGEVIFIFPETVNHAEIARSLIVTRLAKNIISAGFVTLHNNELFCHGESISLKLKSRPVEDNKIANRMFGKFK